jgi:hypothetical protein
VVRVESGCVYGKIFQKWGIEMKKRDGVSKILSYICVLCVFVFGIIAIVGSGGGGGGGSSNTGTDVVLDVPFVANYGGTCVASSFTMVLQCNGTGVTFNDVLNVFGYPPFDQNEYGNFNDWIVNDFGLEMRHYSERTIDDVILCIDEGYPAIVHQQDSLSLAEGHMRVVIGYNLENNVFIIHDPSNRGANYRENFDTFETLWELITNIEPVQPNQIFLIVPVGEPSPLD